MGAEADDANVGFSSEKDYHGPNVYLVYAWGVVVLAMLCYLCSKVSEIHRLLQIAVPDEHGVTNRGVPALIAARLRSSAAEALKNVFGDNKGSIDVSTEL